MKAKIIFSIITILAIIALVACDSGKSTRADGEPCNNIGEYGCFDDIVHLCRYENGVKFWEPKQDCAQSETANCECTVFQGLGTCKAAGTVDSFCKGAYY